MIFQNMEPAQTQLARPLPPLCLKAGTSNPSIYSDHLALTFMSEWHSFREDALQVFREAGVSHNVPFHDETELYTVGNELGVSGRFVRNLCDPVMKALEHYQVWLQSDSPISKQSPPQETLFQMYVWGSWRLSPHLIMFIWLEKSRHHGPSLMHTFI